MVLPSVKKIGKGIDRAVIRTNYDVPLASANGSVYEVMDGSRIEESVKTISYLLENRTRVVVISHLGRPEGHFDQKYSLSSVALFLGDLLKRKITLCQSIDQAKASSDEIVMLENLRFWPEEESNDSGFANKLATMADVYVNDAFACSHRSHASVVGIPKFLPSFFGFDFVEEVDVLSNLRNRPKRPVVLVIGGKKEDKITYLAELIEWADKILIGGALVKSARLKDINSEKIVIADLAHDGQDISIGSSERFAGIVKAAATVVMAGPMGNFYEKDSVRGTRSLVESIGESEAYFVIGGGDTETAISMFGLEEKIDFVSSGGGAMLDYLALGTSPAIQAIVKSKE